MKTLDQSVNISGLHPPGMPQTRSMKEIANSSKELSDANEAPPVSYADQMPPEQAERYLRFLENGSMEGLTDAEIAAIRKVDEALALKRVDGQSILDLRNPVESGPVLGGDSKTISFTDYDNIYQSSIHNAGKDKVMLGKYDGGGATSYITKAGSDYEYFSLGSNWDTIKNTYGYTDDEMFKLFNEAFLDDGINARKTFQFSHNLIGDQGALGKEYMYLLQNNYLWDETTMTMIPKY